CGQALPTPSPLVQTPPVQTPPGGVSILSPGPTHPTGTLARGVLLNGRYRIRGLVGTGGMGAVYKAADTQLGDRLVAVKELSVQGLTAQERAEATEAFTREAVLLASLHHPSLPNIHDHFTADGRWYMVMDLIPGDTLEAYLHHAGRPGLPVGE